MPVLLDPILTEVEAFLKRSGMPPTVFGKVILTDPNFVFDLRLGREVRRSTRDKVREFLDANAAPSAKKGDVVALKRKPRRTLPSAEFRDTRLKTKRGVA